MTQADAAVVNPAPGVITVWSDIGCPWGALALHTLREAARRRQTIVAIDHRAFPLELFNRRPTPKLILDAEVVAIAAVRPELRWRSWDRPEGLYPVTTLPALEAVQAAKRDEIGGLRASDELDAALRKAFYVERRCISIPAVIEDAARECPNVNVDALLDLTRRGVGREDVYRQWQVAQPDTVRGSPQISTPHGYTVHNPGVTYRWSAPFDDGGFPYLEQYDDSWAEELLDRVA